MNLRQSIALSGAFGMIAIVTMGACSAPESSSSPEEEKTATVEMAFSGQPSFYGNSILITATRSTVADSKYPCKSYESICFDFDAEGHPINPYTYKNGFEDLCPTVDVDNYGQPGYWTFEYDIYTQPGCGAYGGVLLNADYNPNNFVCFDSEDLLKQKYPNASVGEVLYPGQVKKNTIICASANADKQFDFNSCELLANDPGYYVKLDCGCKADAYGACKCDQFDSLAGLPYECAPDPYDYCNIVCHY